MLKMLSSSQMWHNFKVGLKVVGSEKSAFQSPSDTDQTKIDEGWQQAGLLYSLFPAGLVQDVFIKWVSSSPH